MENRIPKTLREAGYEIYCDAEKLGALDIPVVDFEIKDLIWNFDLSLWGKDGESWNLTPWDVINKVPGSASQRKRVEEADLNFPILVLKKNGRWLIVDGVHRLVKRYLKRQQTISVKIVTRDLIKKYPWKAGSKNINMPRKMKRSKNATGNENMQKIDVIIILGGGVDKRGRISEATKKRLDIFLKVKNVLSNKSILLSGRWGGLMGNKSKTEAQAMKEYLLTNGISAKKIYLETKSLDTISNAVFSKEIVEKHKNWKKILLVTSDWHMKRSLWIFRKVFGKSYQIYPLPVISNKDNKKRRKYEAYLLAVAKRILEKIQLRDMNRALQEFHPFYSNSKEAKKLLKEVVSKQKELFL